MESLFQELKRIRESKQISLADIADITLINVRFLEAIEQGNISILPQTYVRAFIREYAVVIGLDPEEVLKRYTEATSAPAPAAGQQPSPTPAPRARPQTDQSGDETSSHVFRKGLARGAIVGVALAAGVIIVWNMRSDDSPKSVQETPFQNVIKENARRLPTPPPLELPVQQAAPSPTPVDSLTLSGTASDSVWVRVLVDEGQAHEYLFRPRARFTWRARDRFRLTLGNAGGIEFTLNQKKLGTLGPRGTVVRDVDLSRQTLTAR